VGGAAAADLLGVKRETLYAYVSRGLLASQPGPRGRGRLYLREDIERLKVRRLARAGHGAVAASALRGGGPVLESAITAIAPGGPRYRGHAAVDLVRAGTTFECAAELLWSGALSTAARWSAPTLGVRAARLASLTGGGAHPLVALALATPALAAA